MDGFQTSKEIWKLINIACITYFINSCFWKDIFCILKDKFQKDSDIKTYYTPPPKIGRSYIILLQNIINKVTNIFDDIK